MVLDPSKTAMPYYAGTIKLPSLNWTTRRKHCALVLEAPHYSLLSDKFEFTIKSNELTSDFRNLRSFPQSFHLE